ncbi:MAG: hypothetical protein HDR01_03475 [Lachnospiraceae bacterium]|nr:hypothetical protein [Lachnospiraceae bacterium]
MKWYSAMRNRIKKRYVFSGGLFVCLCLLLGWCILGKANSETDKSEISDSQLAEMIEVTEPNTEMDKNEVFGTYLAQTIEESFMDLEVVKAADAEIAYDKTSGQYAIEMSLETAGEISDEEIETYKRVLNNYHEFAEMTLKINGECK